MLPTTPSPTTITVTTERKGKPTHVATLRPKRGHTLFKFSKGHLSHVTDEDYADVLVMGASTRQLITQPDTHYLSALNLKNVVKRLNRNGHYVEKYTPC